MVKLGKITFRQLEDTDIDRLQKFCEECSKLGYTNNSSFQSIKLDKMRMPYGKYFVGVDESKDRIFNLAGVHHLPEIAPNAWRCLFRGAQLPGYAIRKGLSKNMLRTGYQLAYILPMQIDYIKKQYDDAEFYMTTNIDKDGSGKSIRMGKFVELLLRDDILIKHSEQELFYTMQKIWKIDLEMLYLKLNQFVEKL